MSKHYDSQTYNECKKLFIEKSNSPREIAKALGGKPSFQTINRWAIKKDADGKTWLIWREEYEHQQYEILSPQAQINKIFERISAILNEEKFDVKSADQLSKLNRYMRDIIDPQYQIHIMYGMLSDLVGYFRKNHPDLVTEKFLDTIRDFKNYLRSRLQR